jgi:hypothetical protein
LTLPHGIEPKSIEVVAIPTNLMKLNQFSGKWSFTDENDRFDFWPFSSLAQVLAVLAAPLVFRKFGLVTGIVYTQVATAVALTALATATGAAAASIIYMGYTGLLWMSEPGIFSLLMDQVDPAERAGASALTFLVISLAQSVSVAVAGASLTRFGYPSVLMAITAVASVAALSFWSLLGGRFRMQSAPASLDP